jgi:hypothetical protein
MAHNFNPDAEYKNSGCTYENIFYKGLAFNKNSLIERKDAYNNTIHLMEYDTNKKNSWHVNHIIPQSKGGKDCLDNLQPMECILNKKLNEIVIGKLYHDGSEYIYRIVAQNKCKEVDDLIAGGWDVSENDFGSDKKYYVVL